MTDTTAEAVDRLASRHTIEADAWASDGAIHDLAKFHRASAATLRALVAERDAAQAWAKTAFDLRDTAHKNRDAAYAERDAALAREARLREALMFCVEAHRTGRYEAACFAHEAARAALAQEPPA